MAISLTLSRIVLQPFSSRLPVVTNFYPTCRQLLISKPVTGYRTPLVQLQTKASGSQQVTKTKEEPKKEEDPDVQLFDESGNLISLMKKDKAIKLARLKELKLVEIKGSSSSVKQPLSYQLMTGKQLHENRQKEREIKKDKIQKPEEKVLTLKGSISDHDLEIKVKRMNNFLEKDFNLKIIIKTSSANQENSRKQQSSLLKKITDQTMEIATVKKASSKDTELIILLKKKSLP